MKQVQYDGFELDHFDSATNFRFYQLSLIRKYLKDNFLEVGAGKGGLASVYKRLLKNITLIEPDKKLFKILKNKFKKKKIRIEKNSIKKIKKKIIRNNLKNFILESPQFLLEIFDLKGQNIF